MSDALLAFQGASFRTDADHDCALEGVAFELARGQLALIQLPPRALRLPLADGAQGLLHPYAGQVLFEGRTWRERTPEERTLARQFIGRVYEGAEWISNLDLDENVILPACHHTTRPEQEIVAEALKLAARFGLTDLPAKRRTQIPRADLRAFALVRAFLGEKRLLLLERPLREAAGFLGEPFAQCLREARERGAAVLWTTDSPAEWGNPAWHPDLRLVVRPPHIELYAETFPLSP